MPKIVYVRPDGTRHTVDVAAGTSVMQGAIRHDVAGIVAECGGNTMCATCHVYVDEADADRLGPVSPDEDEMLEATASPRTAASRLSCCVVVDDDLDGLTVHLPEEQL
ncbi:2Fe-2S iron-sulfur cluster-binding protein [Saccharothrix australiensis]|uniref:2Fe-2S ferredoxin n=1 Tax=Saccharothrix australiensis TaxID=2072 RepID=A0A495VZ75_9PSEU|nr:2Fe-2S iron-sulfur cluster-binding protein [Saccharothrix australiensis]RKT54656.1 2Fe-2S ferredoxin [Saccharothrix australiensis]